MVPEERKLVTVLFADVTGSTELGEDLDPEDVRALMGRYYDLARQVVSDHGGTLEKFIGDAVMAVYGLPRARGDDAERAVAAALVLRQAVENDPMLRGMTLRIGVNTGEVIATSDASRGDFLVTGDPVNVAARVQQHARPGEILVSERTRAATQAVFHFGESQEADLKGKRGRVSVSPVHGLRPTRHVVRPPLVGRKRELAQLSLLQSWALDEQRPQLVSIVAPAGTGKTRLLEEFLATLDPDDRWRVATGRCLPYGQTLTYWPLRGLLTDLTGEIERERVVHALLRGGYSAEDATRLADLVLAPLGIEGEGLTERESIFNAWRLLIEMLAGDAPRIIVFEDLHWASDSLLDLVEHVMHPRTQAPLLLIAISRPELLDRRPSWGGGGRENSTALVLKPLTEAQTAELVESLGPTLPEAIRRGIADRSGGNPFFATELVRSLAERRGDSMNPDVVPDTVQAAILARLDALSPVERTVVQAASVAGRSFRPATLSAVLDAPERVKIHAAIDGLVARDLAVPVEGGAYAFRHVLIRDVAYGTLSRSERVRLHAAVAAWLEEYAGDRLDEFVELIAYHYREAVLLSQRSAVPMTLPFDPNRAVSFLERAGELASRAGALVEASRHLQSAIAIAPKEDHKRLYERLGDCLFQGTAAMAAYQEALTRWRETGVGDPLGGARLLRKLLVGHTRWATDPPTAETLSRMAEEARHLADAAGDEDESWRIKVAEAFCLWGRGGTDDEVVAGQRTATAAAAHFERRGDWLSFSEALDAYIALAMARGSRREMIEAAQRRLAAPTLHLAERGDALAMMIQAHSALGEFDRCLTLIREALTQLRPGDSLIGCAQALADASWAAFLNGRWPDLDDFTRVAEDALLREQEDVVSYNYWPALVLALARQDRAAIDRAASAISARYPNDGEAPRQRFRPAWLATLVEDDPALLDLSLTQHVHGAGFEAVVMFMSEHGVALPDAFLERVTAEVGSEQRGTLFWSAEIAAALRARDWLCLERAIDEAERHGMIPHAARMRVALAHMVGDPAHLDRARPVLERLGDRQALRRLDEVTASLR